MKKKLVSFMCAVMAALCLVVSNPAQAYAAPEDEVAPQYIGISQISANLHFENGTAYCRELPAHTRTIRLIWSWS